MLDNIQSLSYFIPELILTTAALAVILAEIFGAERCRLDLPGLLALGATLLAFEWHFGLYSRPSTILFSGMLVHDPFSTFFRGFFLLTTAVVIVMTMFSKEVIFLKRSEFYSILLSVCIGMNLVAASQDLVMAYLALELMSIGSYLLAGFSRKVGKSDEAALKFVIYGGVSTAILLFGLSLLYGLTGTTGMIAIRDLLQQSSKGIDLVAYTIFLLILVGVGYKIAAVPFHFWAPDVYEGSPTSITAFLSVASKGAGFALMIRLFFTIFLGRSGVAGLWMEIGNTHIDWTFHIALLSAVTMTIGNLGAIPQMNLKRLLAYSGIAHAGYLLMGVCLLTDQGLEAVIFYLVTYLFTNLSAFLVVIIAINAQDDERISGVQGLWARAPYAAILMAVSLFSLIGLPPTAGFVGKYYLFVAVLGEKLYWLAVVGAINTVVSLYYYARIVKAMFLEPAASTDRMRINPVFVTLLIFLSIPILYFGIFWDPLVKYAKYCTHLMQ